MKCIKYKILGNSKNCGKLDTPKVCGGTILLLVLARMCSDIVRPSELSAKMETQDYENHVLRLRVNNNIVHLQSGLQ